MKRTIFLTLISLSMAGLAFGQQIPVDSTLRTGKLSNGLTYYIKYNPISRGTASFFIAQKVGSILEQDNQRGLAHFLEHEAFNGTVHFPGTSVVKEMEKKGVRFGSHINAYTSFDETVYNMNDVPTTREGIVDTAMLILHDWSGEITNLQPDIEEERGIIREEWRTRSSASLRMDEKVILPTLLAGTPYANRIPIGTMEVVNHFKRQELVDYYKKWYRPDLQGIIIVGDVNPDAIVAKLQKLFEDIPAPINPAKRDYVKVPDNDAPIVAIATDPEFPSSVATVYWKEDDVPFAQRNTGEYFKRHIIDKLISNLIDDRLNKVTKKKGSLMINPISRMNTYSISERPAWRLEISVAGHKVPEALKEGLTECERMRRFGFSKNEFEPVLKHFYLSMNETEYKDRDVTPSQGLIKQYVNSFLGNEPNPSPEWKYRTTKDILENITMDTINYYAQRYIHDNNMAFEITMPDKAGVTVPTKEELLAVWDEVKHAKLKPWVKEKEHNVLTHLKTPEPAAITNTQKNTIPLGYTKWTFANGVSVWFKHTNVKESTVVISGYKRGGFSLANVKDLPTAEAYNQLSWLCDGFDGFDGLIAGTPQLGRNMTTTFDKASSADLKLLFQHVYIEMTRYKMKRSAFDNYKSDHLQTLRNRVMSAATIYRDTLNAIIRNHNPWSVSLADSNELKKVDYKTYGRLHKEFFGDARGFTFIIAGNVDEDTVRSLASTWLGGLPSKYKEKPLADHGVYPPKGVIKRHLIEKMGTPKTTVGIVYTGEMPITIKKQVLMQMTTEMLNTVYLRTIRQKEGASYGVSVQGAVDKYPKDRYFVQISFDTDPDPVKKEKMVAIVYDEIKKLMDVGPDKDIVEKARADFHANYLSSTKFENSLFWDGAANYYYEYGIDFYGEYDKTLLRITGDDIRNFAKNIFSQGNLIEVKMDPAK